MNKGFLSFLSVVFLKFASFNHPLSAAGANLSPPSGEMSHSDRRGLYAPPSGGRARIEKRCVEI